MYTINIKQDSPPADVAVANMLREIELCKLAKTNAIKIIHGYGSHGVGGLIKQEAIKALKQLKAKKQILDFISGEKFSQSNKYYKKLIEEYPELILDSDLYPPNSGLTIVLIKLGGFGNI
jgi:hypothetical protein